MCPENNIIKPSDLDAAMQKLLANDNTENMEELLGFGHKLADYYANIYCIDEADQSLQEAASEGFSLALKRFDPKYGESFSYYAANCIISEIRREIRSRNVFKVPEWLKRLQEDVINATEVLATSKSSLPSLKEIAGKINIAEEGITETMQAGSISMEDVNLSAIKSLRHNTFKMPVEDVITIRKSLDRLSNIQTKVLELISVNLSELNMAIEEEESAFIQTHAKYTRVVEEGSESVNSTETAKGFKVDFPDLFIEEEVQRYFELLSDEHGLRLLEIRSVGKPEEAEDKYVKVPLDICFEGRYRGLLQLLDYLRSSEKAIRVERVRATRNEQVPARITISVAINSYYRNSVVI